MKRRLIAAAIFLGILLLLLWFSQPSADAATQRKKHVHTKASAKPCVTVVLNESPRSKKEDSSDEVTFDPQYVNWHRSPMTAAPLGFVLGWFSLPIYFARLRRGAPQPLHLNG